MSLEIKDVESGNWSSREAMFQREFRDRRGDRFDGGSFREKSDYKPKVNIKYINDKGDEMTPKEVFIYTYLLYKNCMGLVTRRFDLCLTNSTGRIREN